MILISTLGNSSIIPFIYGNKDKFNPIERINGIIEAFPNVDIKIIENTGHNSFIENPDRCLEIVSEFVEAH